MSYMRDIINLLESAQNDPLGIVARIRDIDTRFLEHYEHAIRANPETRGQIRDTSPVEMFTKSPFHLAPCGRCHAPVWCQPCPVCNWYPMGSWDGEYAYGKPKWQEEADRLRKVSKGIFTDRLNKAGNIAAWFFKDKSKLVAFKHPDVFNHWVGPYLKEALEQQWPTAEEIWAAYGPGPEEP